MTVVAGQPFLELRGIKKKYGNVESLKGIDLKVYMGEVLAIVGDNGAGKSTIIKILAGAIFPDSGVIIIDGKKYRKLNPRKAIAAGVSTVYQDLALVNTLDVADNLFLGQEHRKYGVCMDKKKMRQKTGELLKQLQIKMPFPYPEVGYLSGGQRQSVAVARAVHQGGRLLIFDEPTAAMGIKESAAVFRLIRTLTAQGLGVIIVSHNMEQVFNISDRICIMRQGEIAGYVNTNQVQPQDVVATIMGAIGFSDISNIGTSDNGYTF